jgi:hypothetical protein
METRRGKIIEVQQNWDGSRQAVIDFLAGITPSAGQYLQAFNPVDGDAPAAESVFLGGLQPPDLPANRFLTAPGIPLSWSPGDELILRGPLGKGFAIPAGVRRAALAAFGGRCEHLLPLAGEVLASGGEVALFTDGEFPKLPASIEVNPLQDIEDALRWADYAACSSPLENLSSAYEHFQAARGYTAVQLLVLAPMPCGALAACGVCAFRWGRRKYLLACEEGPVFDLKDL